MSYKNNKKSYSSKKKPSKGNKHTSNASRVLGTAILGIIIIAVIVGIRTPAETKAAATPEPTIEPTPQIIIDTDNTQTSEPETTPEPTPEPEPEYYTLSFIGDNTLWANANFIYSPYGLPQVVGDNYAYPYQNTASYFKEDEYTLANL